MLFYRFPHAYKRYDSQFNSIWVFYVTFLTQHLITIPHITLRTSASLNFAFETIHARTDSPVNQGERF